jgi:hypothetical protein
LPSSVVALFALNPMTARDATLDLDRGESVAVVLQQDDPVLRGFQSQVLVLLGADLVRADVAVPVVSRGAVEEPQPHPDGEEVVEGSVDVLLCDLPLLESIGSVLLHVVAAVHVHS